jgi:O-antigen/teichoic acid export membrane protein
MKAANRVIFNTGVLYAQLIIGIIIGLFTTRLVLNALGETDYGIYILVGGVVGMLGILNSNMSNTSMRYMAHSLGTGDKETTLRTFNTTLFLNFLIGSVVVLIMEVGGVLMFDYLLSIPASKIFDAKIVFHFMVITTFITVISVPYDAVMNSHENILALSLVDILGYILKLGVAIYLTYSKTNLLIMYGFLLFAIEVILRIVKQWYSKVKYVECKMKFREYVDRKLLKEIFSFSIWNLLNSVSALAIVQVKSIFLNKFFGVGINAAEGVARQASLQVNMVSVNMTRALNPQVMKSEGGGDRQRMLYLTELGTKFTTFLFALFAIPLFFEAPFLFTLWLKSVPDYVVIFFQIIMIAMLIEKFTFEITTAIRAVGNLKIFQITETSILLLNIPIYYIVLKMGYPPYSIFITSIFVSFIGAFVRIYFGKKIAGLNFKLFFENAVFPVLLPIVFSCIFACLPHFLLQESLLKLCITFLFSISVMSCSFWLIGLNSNEKIIFKQIIISTKQKFK